MIILIHVLIAILSMIYTAFVYFFPSKTKLNVAYVLVLSTIISGTYLIFAYSTHMVQTCMEGLVYLGVVSVGLALARQKLAHQKTYSTK